MARPTRHSVFNAFLYGGASVLLAFDVFFLAKAAVTQNFIPILPILVGILVTGGLLLVIYAEYQARKWEKKEHRRLSRVAHQLESPLKTLQEDLAYLVKQADALPAEERLKLKRMDTKATILLENVRDVFLLFRAQQSKVAEEVRLYDVCALVQEAAERVGKLASAHNVEVIQKHHCQHAASKVDRRMFLIALTHILENAVLYTLSPGVVNIAVMKGKTHVRVVVQDRGIGIRSEDVDQILQPFARGHKADQFDPDGIGVGLPLAKLIIEEFGGTLTWRPREKKAGTQVEIKLPLAEK